MLHQYENPPLGLLAVRRKRGFGSQDGIPSLRSVSLAKIRLLDYWRSQGLVLHFKFFFEKFFISLTLLTWAAPCPPKIRGSSVPAQNPLRFESVHKSWERNCFSYVVQAANPSNCSFYTQTKACVFAASVSSDIQIPVKYFFWQALFFNFCF